MTRYNIKENFEDVYLRSNQIKMYLSKADPNLLKDPEFKRTINYISGHFYRKFMGVYRMAGFDLEDICSTASIFGLMFAGYNKEYDTTRDFYNVMMRFVSQRLLRMAGWMIKKFQLDELSPKQIKTIDPLFINAVSLGAVSRQDDQRHNYHNNIIIDGVYLFERDPVTDSENIRRLENTIDLLEQQYETITSNEAQDKMDKINIKISKREAEKALGSLELQKKKNTKIQRDRYKVLKKELNENWPEYTDKLAYYSVSRFVSFGVRKSARSFCKKYGINYSEWADQQIKNRKLDSDDIIIY